MKTTDTALAQPDPHTINIDWLGEGDGQTVLSILAVVPEPISNALLKSVLDKLNWSGPRIGTVIEQCQEWQHTGVLEAVGDRLELAWPLKKQLPQTGRDMRGTPLERAHRLLFRIIQNEDEWTPDVLRRYAAHFAAHANRPRALLKYLENGSHYKRMAEAGQLALAIPSWCGAVEVLDAAQNLNPTQRLALLEPVIPDVVDELEHQYYSMSRLRPVVEPLVRLLGGHDNREIEAFFDRIVRTMRPLAGCRSDVRVALILIQLFGEAGFYERQRQLARNAMEKHRQYDVHYFAAVAACHWGRHSSPEEGVPSLEEALRILEDAEQLPESSSTSSYNLRHSIHALARLGLGNVMRSRGQSPHDLYGEALRHISRRSRNPQVLGYRAQILFELGDNDRAWSDANESLLGQFTGVDAAEVLLKTASSDVLNDRFVPYTRLQALCCSLAHGPFASDEHRNRVLTESVVPFLVREEIWPMAAKLEAELNAVTSRAVSACNEARQRRQTVEWCVGQLVVQLVVDVWRWEDTGTAPRFVLGIDELGIYARGATFESAATNLCRVLAFLHVRRTRARERLRPIDARIMQWIGSRAVGTPEDAGATVRVAAEHYYRGKHKESWAALKSIEAHRGKMSAIHLHEYLRIKAWVGSETGEADGIGAMRELFDLASPGLRELTDLQKAGVARGLTPHPIVEAVHDVVEARGLAVNEYYFTPIERLYYGTYLLSIGRNADAEAALSEALELEHCGTNQARLIARIGDVLSEALRRRGELVLARRILDENIARREAANICIAPSLVQRAKCSVTEDEALDNITHAIVLYEMTNRKERVRAILLGARMVSDPQRHSISRQWVDELVGCIPGIATDQSFRNIVASWDAWCRPSFSPELSYWNW